MNDDPRREFSLGAVLSVTTGYTLAPGRMSDIRGLMEHLTGQALTDTGCMVMALACRSELLRQFPELDCGRVRKALKRLDEDLPGTPREGRQALVDGLVARLARRFGATLLVAPIGARVVA